MDVNELKNILKKFNTVEIGNYPTPLQRIKNFEENNNLNNIYIKRDDLSENPGGNKTRHLKYLLGDAINNNYEIFIISGPIQSNFCTQAAMICKKINFPCILVHNAEEPTEYIGNNLLNHLMEAEQIFVGEISFQETEEKVVELGERLKSQGKNPYIFHTDHSKAIASLGYIDCVIEIVEQCEKENKHIEDIFVPVGNGIFAAGVLYGNALLGQPFNIQLVSVEFNKEGVHNRIKKNVELIEELTNIKIEYSLDEILNIYDDYMGEGWGCPTEESIKVIKELAETEGIFLEKVYTSKGFYGMKDLLKRNIVRSKGACYIHSGGFPSLFTQY
ncbi:MAG: pyridoxal-phosphate dependent enzyme [Tissierellia bacterium]|nr:pyridoxal-phosphate dependent enzyme [Tissierellia bacterium]